MLMGTTLSAILSLPWKMYSTFVIEERHGFNKQVCLVLSDRATFLQTLTNHHLSTVKKNCPAHTTVNSRTMLVFAYAKLLQTIGFFLKDQVKSLVIGWVIGLPILIGVLWIIDKGGDYFFISVWIFMSVVIFVRILSGCLNSAVLCVLTVVFLQILMTIYPEFIAPLFDKYTPLPDGELRSQIEALAAKLKFPLTKLYIVEGKAVHFCFSILFVCYSRIRDFQDPNGQLTAMPICTGYGTTSVSFCTTR